MKITNFTLFTLLIRMGFGVFSVPSNETEALRGMDLDDPETLGEILAPINQIKTSKNGLSRITHNGKINPKLVVAKVFNFLFSPTS